MKRAIILVINIANITIIFTIAQHLEIQDFKASREIQNH